jgi:hypothetical protein
VTRIWLLVCLRGGPSLTLIAWFESIGVGGSARSLGGGPRGTAGCRSPAAACSVREFISESGVNLTELGVVHGRAPSA